MKSVQVAEAEKDLTTSQERWQSISESIHVEARSLLRFLKGKSRDVAQPCGVVDRERETAETSLG